MALKPGVGPRDVTGAMKHAAAVLACRSAPLATAYCDQLCEAFALVAEGLRGGDVLGALVAFEDAMVPMEKLLVFAVIADDLLRSAQHPLRIDLGRFVGALRRGLDRIEEAIHARDAVVFVQELETTVVPALEGYAEFGGRVATALQPRLAA